MSGARLLVRHQTINAEFRENRGCVGEQRKGLKGFIGDQRHKRIQFQTAHPHGLRYRRVIGCRDNRGLRHGFRNDWIDLSRHKRRPGLPLGQTQLSDPGVGAGGK